MANDFTQLLAQVRQQRTVTAGLKVALDGYKEAVQKIISANGDQAQIDSVVADLKSQDLDLEALGAAILENTPQVPGDSGSGEQSPKNAVDQGVPGDAPESDHLGSSPESDK